MLSIIDDTLFAVITYKRRANLIILEKKGLRGWGCGWDVGITPENVESNENDVQDNGLGPYYAWAL